MVDGGYRIVDGFRDTHYGNLGHEDNLEYGVMIRKKRCGTVE